MELFKSILPEVKTRFIVNISGMIDANWNSFFISSLVEFSISSLYSNCIQKIIFTSPRRFWFDFLKLILYILRWKIRREITSQRLLIFSVRYVYRFCRLHRGNYRGIRGIHQLTSSIDWSQTSEQDHPLLLPNIQQETKRKEDHTQPGKC
jgi:hypothetical protein